MICPNCSKENKDTARFCSECGKALIDKPIELDLNQIQVPAVSRKPKIIKVSTAGREKGSEDASKDVNSLFLPKDDGVNAPPLDIHEGEELVQEFKIPENESETNNLSDFAPDFENADETGAQPNDMSAPKQSEPVGIGGWIGTFILTAIPGLNIIMLLIWAIGKKTKPSKKNFAAAVLILMAIGVLLSIVASILLIKFTDFNISSYFNTKS